jgi:hypothetical protein
MDSFQSNNDNDDDDVELLRSNNNDMKSTQQQNHDDKKEGKSTSDATNSMLLNEAASQQQLTTNEELDDDEQPDPLSYQTACVLYNVLKCNKTLTNLDLSHNPLGDPFVLIMAQALFTKECTLQWLRLVDINMSDIGVLGLAFALRYNTTLYELTIHHYRFSEVGVTALGESLKYNRTLKQLEMSDHLFYTYDLLRIYGGSDSDFTYLETIHYVMLVYSINILITNGICRTI